jgi:hypothetical protein
VVSDRGEKALQMLWDASVHTEAEEREALLASHTREIAKLKLESDRRARRVAERMLALCLAEVIGRRDISDTQMSGLRWAMDGINIEALVDESKL